MKVKFLKEATNLQELKKLYFELSKKHHPDMGGNSEIMKAINNEYDYLKTVLENADNTAKNQYESAKTMDAFKDIIDIIIVYPNITIEIIGSWLWISGKGTFAIRDDVLYSKLNCKYSKAQKKFYWFQGIENKQGKYKGGHLKKAIAKYGVQKIQSEKGFVLA